MKALLEIPVWICAIAQMWTIVVWQRAVFDLLSSGEKFFVVSIPFITLITFYIWQYSYSKDRQKTFTCVYCNTPFTSNEFGSSCKKCDYTLLPKEYGI